jgi:hypothetical protein
LSDNSQSTGERVSFNSKSVLVGLFILVGLILLAYTISVSIYSAEEIGRLNSVFIAAISGSLALGGTLIAQLWGGSSSSIQNSPIIYSTTPQDTATDVPLDTQIIASFNRQMDSSTVTDKSFTLKDNENTTVSGTVTLVGGNAIFKPSGNLKENIKYKATITKDVKDILGVSLAADKVWSFTTIQNTTL